MAHKEVAITKEVLHQYIVIKKLHVEIEEERQASATAASEALSMILRLQKEKAEEKMEACQYKRLAEEKLHHAQECSVILEEAMQEKEMEISMLKQQIQLCKSKLLSAGILDLDTDDDDDDQTVLHGHVSRNISLPPSRTAERDAIQVTHENCIGKEHLLIPEETPEFLLRENNGKHAYHNRSVSMPIRPVSKLTNDFETIKCQLEQINCERMMNMEDSERSKEQMKLLRGIYEQLSTIESHMNISKYSKSHIGGKPHLASVMEAFLSFAI